MRVSITRDSIELILEIDDSILGDENQLETAFVEDTLGMTYGKHLTATRITNGYGDLIGIKICKEGE
jgi:hypothetical protein